MAEVRKYYVICEDNCKFESMTKEEIFDAIADATGSTPTPVDEAFITKIKEQNANKNTKVWTGTQAQFNALEETDDNTIYFVDTNVVKSTHMLENLIANNSERITLVDNDLSALTSVKRYSGFFHKSVVLGSSTKTVAHGLSIPSYRSIWDEYEVVQAYVLKTGTDSTKTYYPMPYIYGSAKFINYKLDKDNITVDNNSDWTGYTAHFVFGRKTMIQDTEL